MRVFVAAVTSESQQVKAMMAFQSMLLRDEDKKIIKFGSRGDLARMYLGDKFLESDYDAILLIDLDMIHPPDLLERLRAHDVDMVSAHYFRRHINPMRSVVSLITDDNTWPYPPLINIPDDGLHEIACTGFGCVLIKREVVEAVMSMLPPGSPPFSLGPMPEEANGQHGPFGSDFNFFMRARRAGYKLWLDASLESSHACTVWLDREMYEKLGGDTADTYWKEFWRHTMRFQGINATVLKARIETLEEALAGVRERIETMQDTEKVISGQIAENQLYLKEMEREGLVNMYKLPNVPVFESEEELQKALKGRGKGKDGESPEEVDAIREKVHQEVAMDIVDEISEREPEA